MARRPPIGDKIDSIVRYVRDIVIGPLVPRTTPPAPREQQPQEQDMAKNPTRDEIQKIIDDLRKIDQGTPGDPRLGSPMTVGDVTIPKFTPVSEALKILQQYASSLPDQTTTPMPANPGVPATGEQFVSAPDAVEGWRNTVFPDLANWYQRWGQLPPEVRPTLQDLIDRAYTTGQTGIYPLSQAMRWLSDPAYRLSEELTYLADSGPPGVRGVKPLDVASLADRYGTPTPGGVLEQVSGQADTSGGVATAPGLQQLIDTGYKTDLSRELSGLGAVDPTRALQSLLQGEAPSVVSGMSLPGRSAYSRVVGEQPTDYLSTIRALAGNAPQQALDMVLQSPVVDVGQQLGAMGVGYTTPAALNRILGIRPGESAFAERAAQASLNEVQRTWDEMMKQLREQVLPEIRRRAQAYGQYGSSRQAIVESKALEDATRRAERLLQAAEDQAARTRLGAYQAELGTLGSVAPKLQDIAARTALGKQGILGTTATTLTGQGIQEALGRRQAATTLTGAELGQTGSNQRTALTTQQATAMGLTGTAADLAEGAAGRRASGVTSAWGTQQQLGQAERERLSGLGTDLLGQILGTGLREQELGVQRDIGAGKLRLAWPTTMASSLGTLAGVSGAYGSLGMTQDALKRAGLYEALGLQLYPSEYEWTQLGRYIGAGGSMYGGQPYDYQPTPYYPQGGGGPGLQTTGLMAGASLGSLIPGIGPVIGGIGGWIWGTGAEKGWW